jgi:hypothetical protein
MAWSLSPNEVFSGGARRMRDEHVGRTPRFSGSISLIALKVTLVRRLYRMSK